MIRRRPCRLCTCIRGCVRFFMEEGVQQGRARRKVIVQNRGGLVCTRRAVLHRGLDGRLLNMHNAVKRKRKKQEKTERVRMCCGKEGLRLPTPRLLHPQKTERVPCLFFSDHTINLHKQECVSHGS